jgi:hypothetical protein
MTKISFLIQKTGTKINKLELSYWELLFLTKLKTKILRFGINYLTKNKMA